MENFRMSDFQSSEKHLLRQRVRRNPRCRPEMTGCHCPTPGGCSFDTITSLGSNKRGEGEELSMG